MEFNGVNFPELMTHYHFHKDLRNYLDLDHLLNSS